MSEQQGSNESKWFYEKDGKRHGEVGNSDIRLLIQTGQLTGKNLIWSTGMTDWIAIEKSDFSSSLKTDSPPPLTGAAVNNKIVWVLAFAPFISLVIEYMLAMASYGDEDIAMLAVQGMEYFYIPVILNILISFFDEKQLRAAGHDTSKFKGWIWFVPVYLYQRAENLKQSKAYFWTWIGIFVLSLAR